MLEMSVCMGTGRALHSPRHSPGSVARRAGPMAAIVLALATQGSACRGPEPGMELLRAETSLKKAAAAERDLKWVQGQSGKPMRIHDVVRRTLPASPPSRLEYEVDVP